MASFDWWNPGGGGGGGNQGGGQQSSGGSGGSGGSSGGGRTFSWDNFENLRNQVNEVAQQQALGNQQYGWGGQLNWRDVAGGQYQNNIYSRDNDRRSDYDRWGMSGGTERLYNNKYRKANVPETLAVGAGQVGELLNNLPGNIAGGIGGLLGGDKQAEEWKNAMTFNANNFNLMDGIDAGDAAEVGKFALSLPGMIPGGIFEGANKAYEAVSGAPVQEWRTAKDGGVEIADYELDSSQRAAAGVDAAINVFGTFTGGAGRVVGAAGKAAMKKGFKEAGEQMAKAGSEKEAANILEKSLDSAAKTQSRVERTYKALDNMSKGWITRAGESVAGGPVKNKALQTVFDMGDEAAEEFVQSYADDIRMKNLDENSFDRALTGAAWGAVGGGMMKVGANILNSKTDSRSQLADETEGPDAPVTNDIFERERNLSSQKDGTMTQAAMEEFADRASRLAKLPGSASGISTQVVKDMGNHEIGLGADTIMGIWENGAESQKMLCESFGVDAQVLQDIYNMHDTNMQAAALQQIIDDRGPNNPIYLVAGRNPDTGISACKVGLKTVFRGSGVQLSRMAYKMMGADVDGDRTQIYFNSKAQNVGFLPANFINNTTGNPTVDWDYAAFFKDAKGFENFINTFLRTELPMISDEKAAELVQSFYNATEAKDVDQRKVAMAMFFDNLYKQIKSAYRGAWQQSNPDKDINTTLEKNGRTVAQNFEWFAAQKASQLYMEMENQATYLPSSFAKVMEQASDKEQKAADGMQERVAGDFAQYIRRGDIDGAYTFANICAQLGYKINANTLYSNPFFRQSGQHYYSSHKDWRLLDGVEPNGITSIFSEIIAFSFRLEEQGGDVETALEGLWITTVQDEAMREFSGKGHDSVNGDNFADFVETFVNTYNRLAPKFMQAYQESTTVGQREKYGSPVKKQLPEITSEDIKAGKISPELARAFRKTYGAYRLNSFIGFSPDDEMGQMTLDQKLNEAAKLPGGSSGAEFGGNRVFQNMFKALLRDYNGEESAVGDRVVTELSDIASLLNEINRNGDVITAVQENGTTVYRVKPENMQTLTQIVDALTRLISPKILVTLCQDTSRSAPSGVLNLYTVEGFINTRWGRSLLSGDVKAMEDALGSLLLSYQYREVMDLIDMYRKSGEMRYLHEAQHRASTIADTSGGVLQTAIAYELTTNESWSILQNFTSLDVLHEEKITRYDHLRGDDVSRGSWIVDTFKIDGEEMALSAITERLGKAKSKISAARRSALAVCRSEVTAIYHEFEPADVFKAAKHYADDSNVSFSSDAIASFIFSNKHIVKQIVDKGTTPDSASALHQMLANAVAGGNYSFIDQMSNDLGITSIDNFASNRVQIVKLLFDPKAELTFYDRRIDDRRTFTHKSFYQALLGERYSGSESPNEYDFQAVLEEYPQLVTILGPQQITVRQSADGPSVEAGPSYPFKSAISGYKNNTAQAKNADQRARSKIKLKLMQNPNWWGYLVASSPDLMQASSLVETRRKIDDAIDAHVDLMLALVKQDPDGRIGQTALEDYNGSVFENVMNQIFDSFTMASTVRQLINMENAINNEVVEDATKKMFSVMVVSRFNSEFGLNLKIPSMTFGTDHISQSIKDFLEKNPQMFVDMFESLVSMFNPEEVIPGHAILSRDIRNAVIANIQDLQTQFSKETDPTKKAEIQKKQKALSTVVDNIDSGESFVKLLGYDKQIKSSVKGTLFTHNDFSDIDADAAVRKAEAIVNKYGSKEDFDDEARKDIEDAWSNGDKKAQRRLLLYYNNIVLSYTIKQSIQGSGIIVNPDMAYQEINAQRELLEMAEEMRADEDLMKYIEKASAPTKVSALKFHYGDRALSYMATSATFNAQSGSTGTGIGIDGAMMKAVAAFGLVPADIACNVPPEAQPMVTDANGNNRIEFIHLDENNMPDYSAYKGCQFTYVAYDEKEKKLVAHPTENEPPAYINWYHWQKMLNGEYTDVNVYHPEDCNCTCCKNHKPQNKSRNARNLNPMSGIIEVLSNWMQEDRHLRRKKSVGISRMLLGDTTEHPELKVVYEFDSNQDLQAQLRTGVSKTKAELVKFYTDIFESESKLPLSKSHAVVIANSTMPYTEVVCNDGFVVRVSTYALHDVPDPSAAETEMADPKRFAYYQAIIDSHGGMKSHRPAIVSIEEMANKILRTAVPWYQEHELAAYALAEDDENYGKVDVKELHQQVWDAMTDWNSYNTESITADDIMSKVLSRSAVFSSPTISDIEPTAVMKFDDRTIDKFNSSRVVREGNTNPFNNDTIKSTIENANEYLERSGLIDYGRSRFVTIARVTRSHELSQNDVEYDLNTDTRNIHLTNEQAHTDYTDGNGRRYAEMYLSPDTVNVEQATNHWREAQRKGRIFITTRKVAESIGISNVVINSSESIIVHDANGQMSKEYICLDPNIDDFFKINFGNIGRMSTYDIDPNSIMVAMFDDGILGLTDGGHAVRQGYEPLAHDHDVIKVKMSSLFREYKNNPISIVDDYRNMPPANTDEFIDYSAYVDTSDDAKEDDELKGRSGRSLSSYKQAVNNYLEKVRNAAGNPRIMSDVRRGECIGFVRHKVAGGKFKYAPLFFEGTVPDSGVNLVVADDGRGNIGLVYNTNKVQYSGPNAMKLDAWGMAYKSVGVEASDEHMEKWPAYRLGKFIAYFNGGGPEVVYDRNAALSRSASMHDEHTIQNLFFFTRKAGMNLFYQTDVNGNFTKNPAINWEYFDDNPDVLVDLMAGKIPAWKDVASGNTKIFATKQGNSNFTIEQLNELNTIMSNVVNEVVVRDGFPHLLFCPRRLEISDKNTDSPKFVSNDCYFMDYLMAFQNFSRDQVLKLFNGIDPALCPYGVQSEDWVDDFSTIFDDSGRMVNANGKEGSERWDTLIGPHFYTGEGTAISNVSREATFGPQHLLKRMLAGGIFPPNLQKTMSFLGLRIDNPQGFLFDNKSADQKYKLDDMATEAPMITGEAYERAKLIQADPLVVASSTRYRRECSDILKELDRPLKVVISLNNQESVRSDELAYKEILAKYEELNDALGIVRGSAIKPLSEREIMARVRLWMGYTDNNGRGITQITKNQLIECLDNMISTVREHGVFILGGAYRGHANGVRVHIPLAPKDMLLRDMQFPNIAKGMTITEYQSLLVDQLKEATMPEITKIKSAAQKASLRKFADSVAYANGYNTISGHVLDDLYLDDIIEACRISSTKLEGYSEGFREAYEQRKLLSVEYIDKIEDLIRDRHSITYEDASAWGGTKTTFTTGDASTAAKVLRTLAQMRRSMGMATPMLIPANVGERVVNQGTQSLALRLGRIGIGPYAMKTKINPDIIKAAARDKDMVKIYAAYRTAQMVGAGEEMLMAFRNGGDIDAIIEEHLNALGVFSRYQSKFMNIMSGGSIAISGQIENFLWRFAQRAEDESPLWFMRSKDADGVNRTIFESKLQSDPSGFFAELMSSNGPQGNADLLLARQCMEWAKRGDMAQKTSVSQIFTEIATRSAAADFAITAFVSPYLNYSINRMGRVLQWVAPVSSIYYLFTDYVTNGNGANKSIFGIKLGDMALEDAQFNKSFKEALMIDAMHLGPQLLAFLLLGVAAMDPPDDEEKWGNYQEWTIFGIRVNAEWWIEDILGLALPVACFGRSCQLGKPRFDLIVNGLSHYLNNNPIAKVSDVVSVLFDPFDELYRDYENDVEGYAKAMGGPPSLADVFYGKGTAAAATFVTQFCTPSFLREWYNDSQQWEKSYKKIYEETATGHLSEQGAQGKTQYTTYGDAMLRKITRKNPVMGFLCDAVLHPNTSYMASGMPDTIIYDPEQMESVSAFSLYTDPYTKKEEKSEIEKQAIALQVVAILQSTNDMGSLVSSGFQLDYDTKKYVSQYIWDQIATLNEEYYAREKNGELDYYVLGDGDFNVGKAIGLEIKQNHYDQVAYWKSLYYDKLWSDEMKQGVVQYRRYNTSYLQDATGDWYATGFMPTTFMPVQLAPEPSQTDGWKAVLGRDEDWQTQSVVTGNATGQRALVPVENGTVQTPNIEAWSTDGTDTGHSEAYINGALNNANGKGSGNGSDSTSSNNKYPNGYPKRSYGGGGGGGGYRRRGGGGGGGYRRSSYVPSTSAPSVRAPITADMPRTSLSKVNPSRIMDADRIIDADEYYLRPDFETKGSREAYKRSDI